MTDFELWTPEFESEGYLGKAHELDAFGGSGDNRSPALEWNDPPAGTKSYALTLYDPAAPTGSGFWHWVMFNIPAEFRSLSANAGMPDTGKVPAGVVQAPNDFGTPGYGGPCPPEGDDPHPYRFTLHALDVENLGLDAGVSNPIVRFMINNHTIATTGLVGYYGR